jgi:plastocyanin
MLYTTASILAFAAAASAVTIPVSVGVVGDKPNFFSPEDITAEVGDIIEFKFNPKVIPLQFSTPTNLTNLTISRTTP